MATETRFNQSEQQLGALGWFSMIGFVSMLGLYYADVITGGNGIAPTITLPIGIVAGIGVLLFWMGNDPTID